MKLPPPLKITRKRLLVAGGAVAVALVLGEVVVRCLGQPLGIDPERIEGYRAFVRGEGPRFEPRAYMSFTRPPGSGQYNSLGFSDREWDLEKAPGTLRIVCLGGSTTESGNPNGRRGSYPYMLEEALEKWTGRDFEVMNCGISGWTTAESLAAWFLLIQDFEPDLVVIHHAVNDVMPRNTPDFRPDYTHWRRPWEKRGPNPVHGFLVERSDLYAWFTLRTEIPTIIELTIHPPEEPLPFGQLGFLPPETAEPFRRNLESIGLSAQAHGAAVCLMTMPIRPAGDERWNNVFRDTIPMHNRLVGELAAEHGWILADAARLTAANPKVAEDVFIDIAHLTRKGNMGKAKLLAEILIREWLVPLEDHE